MSSPYTPEGGSAPGPTVFPEPNMLSRRGGRNWLGIAGMVLFGVLAFVGFVMAAYATAEVNSMKDGPSDQAIKDLARQAVRDDLAGRVEAAVQRSPGTLLTSDPNKDYSDLGYSRTSNLLAGFGFWTGHPDLSFERSDLGVVSDGTYLYIVGGVTGDDNADTRVGQVLNDLVRYDPATRQHKQLTSMPEPRYRAAVALAGGAIYVMGGITSFNGAATDTVLMYNIAEDQWTRLGQTLPAARSDGCAAAVGNKVYLFAGYTADFGFMEETLMVEPLSGSDARITNVTFTDAGGNAPVRRGDCKAVGLNGKMFVLGGWQFPPVTQGLTPVDVVEEYDPVSSQFNTRAPMQTARGDLAVAATAEGTILAVGGEVARNGTGESKYAVRAVEAFNPITNTWRRIGRLPTGRFRHGAATADGHVFVVGGQKTCDLDASDTGSCDPANTLDTIQEFRTHLIMWVRDADTTSTSTAAIPDRDMAIVDEAAAVPRRLMRAALE